MLSITGLKALATNVADCDGVGVLDGVEVDVPVCDCDAVEAHVNFIARKPIPAKVGMADQWAPSSRLAYGLPMTTADPSAGRPRESNEFTLCQFSVDNGRKQIE